MTADIVLTLAVMASALFIGCAPAPDPPALSSESSPVGVAKTSAHEQVEENPFTSPSLEGLRHGAVTECARLSLTMEDMRVGEPLRGKIIIANKCDVGVAVLVGPVEARLRLEASTRFMNETVARAAYSLLYVYSTSAGLPRDVFRGDGGEAVRADPDYAVVLPGETKRIPLTADVELREGKYGAAVICPVVATRSRRGSSDVFDAAKSAERYGSPVATPVRLRSGVSRLSAANSFAVHP